MKRSLTTTKVIIGLLCSISLAMLAAPALAAFHFTITSDQRGHYTNTGKVFQAIKNIPEVNGPGIFHISCGDIDDEANNMGLGNNRALIDTYFGSSFPWFPAVSNHEAETDADMTWLRNEYLNANSSPNRQPLKNITDHNGPTGSVETSYSWDYGNTHFIMLNVYWDGSSDNNENGGDIIPALYNWLVADLAANKKPFIFVFMHEPSFPYNHHYGDSLDQYPTNRNNFWSLLESHKVTAVFNGHTHYYSKHQGDYRGHTYNYPQKNSWRTQDPNKAGLYGNVWQIDVGNGGYDPGGVEAGPIEATDWLPTSNPNLQWNGMTFIDVNVTNDYAIIKVYRDPCSLSDPNIGQRFTLADTITVNGDFLAYNDCVLDYGLIDSNTDPCGNRVHYGDPNRITAYGIGTISSDKQDPNAWYISSGLLKDYVTGANTTVTATLTQSGNPVWQPMTSPTWSGGYDCTSGTDAYNTFHGKADMAGNIYYGSAGWYVDVNFTGLDPNKTYTFATSASRAKDRTDGAANGYSDRWTMYTISGINSAYNASTAGTTEVNSNPYIVRFNTGNNHFEGYVARWTGINPGTDGTFKVRAEATPDANAGGVKAYAFSVFMLKDEPTTPDNEPPTPNPMTWASIPTATGPTTITMTATTATEPNYPPVQYYFECTTDANKNSAWQTNTTYVASGLNPNTLYTFRVKARDTSPNLNETGWSGNASAITAPAGAMPQFVAAGTIIAGTAAITPALPSGIAAGDILLLFLEDANQVISIANQNGGTWTQVLNSPQATTGAIAAATRLTVFWSRYNGTQGAPTTSDSGDHQIGRIVAFRGVVGAPSDPWDVTAGGVESTSDTSGSIPGATTTVDNTLIVAAIATALPDACGIANFGTWTNSNLTDVNERTDDTQSAGNGGGLGIATGKRATAGAYGNTAVTLATSAYKGMISIALKPASGSGTPPGAASSPSPANGAPNININADMSWTAGADANLHDVYFGTNPTPGVSEFKGTQTGTTYDPGTLLNNTTYYWRIDEKNAGGTTTGTVWSFTTVTAVEQRSLITSASSGGTVTTPGIGTYWYNQGTDANIVASANANYHFVNWTGTAVTAGKVANPNLASTKVTMDANYTVQANFAIDTRSLTTSSTAGGTVSTPGIGTYWYNIGTDANIVAAADPNYHFVNWTGTAVTAGKVANPNLASTKVTMDANYTVQANFALPIIPDVTGQTQVAAEAAIVAATFTVGTVTPVYSNTVAAGLVISQTPIGGTPAASGTAVNIVVSLGKPVVPNVVGSTQAAATTAITAVDNLTVGTVTTAYSDTVAAGLVISQTPVGGTEVNIGSSVDIVVSLGKPVVPNVVGSTQAAATTAITAVDNLTVGTVTTAYSDTVAAGLVISQTPVGGTEVNIGSSVDLVISLGKPVVPNVVGSTQAAATTAITAVDNLTVGTVTTAYSDTVAAGLVISQTPVGGTEVNIGSSVDLVISLGKPVVPNVVGSTQAAATTAITAVDNLTVGTVTQAYSDTVAVGLVISQTPVGGTEVNIGSSVDIVVSLGKPVVPNVVGSTQAAATTAITAVDNLTVGTVTTAYSDTVAAGLVISQTPVGGTEVNIGSSVDLVISLGKPVVPNVVGSTQAAATTAITAVDNLTVGTVTQAYSNTVAVGLVISQTPVGGTEVNIGSSVDIVVSLGKPVVPNVVGSTQAAATTAITAVDNLTVGTVTTAYSDTVAAGLVISQTPVGGTEVNIGSSVDLVISLGKPVVPNVVGSTQAAATTAITAVDNLTVGTVTQAYSDTVAVGLVISQTPVGGTEVNIGSSVDLVISLGKPVVPNVVGSTQAAATTAITAVDNLTVGTVTTAYSDTVAAGLVISQTPVGGTEVNIGSSVDLVISLGKPVVPNVVGSTQAAATTAITAVDNLTVGTVTTAYSDTVAAGLVISQTPVGGTEVNIGSSVDLVISLGKPVVPNVVGSTQAAATTAITAVDNLTVGTVTQAYSDTVAVGLVISQTPVGGTEVNIGSSVDLVISLGKPVVPNVVGSTQAAATTAITAVDNLTVGTVTTAYSDTVAAGLVISQTPVGGTEVNIGSSVDLVISLGKPVVPNVVGSTQAAATTAITAVDNLTVGTVTTAYSDTVAAGLVISQTPVGGTEVNIGSSVDLVISLGKPVVPNVVGSTQAAATTAITAVDNLTVGTVTTAYSDTVAAGLVISQTPVGGTEVNIGSSVDLVISLGKPVVPNVVGSTQAAATTAITAVDNLTVGTVTTAYSDTVAAGLVISQTPVGGTEVNIGSSVDLVISLGKPVVPNVVGSTQAAATTAITAVDNLTVGTVTTAYSDTVAAGLVISQTPVGGTEVNIGSSVDLVISLGKPVVPNVVGSTQAAATTAITAVDNLTVGTVTTAYSDTVAAGLVISQTPVGGTEVNIGSSVDLVISLGKPVVPNVVGSTQAAATTAITAVDNLTVGTVTTAYSDTVAAGLVISQTPVGGTEVNIGSSVDLVISLGKPVVPNVVGSTQAAATTAITAVDNLTVGTVTQAYSNTVAVGLVISQTPVGGTEVNIGSSVDIVVSLGKPVVPNVVGSTQAAATTAITAVDNLTVGTVTTAYSDTVAAGLVISQTPVGGTEVNIGSSVDLVISLGKPVVPNVVGSTQAAATTAITAVDNLTVGTVTQAYSDTVAVGLVISQTPVGGTEVNIGSSVDLVISLGKPVVPNVVGSTQAAATTAITAVDNLTVGTVTTAYSDTVAAGLVISQTPVGGTEVNIGSSVDLVISLGKPVVPNVVGSTQAAATTAITAVDNLTVGTVTTAYSDTVAAGLVISQTPVGGTEVNIGSSVDLVISLGKPVVPNVVGSTQAAATTAITAVDNLTVGTVTQAYSDTVAVGLVISQTPVGGTEVNIGSSVDLVISLGKPVVPNVVGSTQAAATTAITAVDNLTVGTVTTAYSDTVAAGLVISQTPVGGTEVNIGSSVDLVISLGKPVVPNVVGSTQAAATTAITAVDNLTVGTVTTAYSDTVAAGLVISQTPVGGTEVNIGSSVDLVISLGKPVVPNVVGSTQAAATTAITAVDNLTVGTVTTAYSDTVAAGLVISQTPVGGTEVNIGSSVDLVISLGKPVVPNVVGSTQAAATTAITAVDNLTVGTVTTAYSDTVAAGLVISQTPVGGTEVNIGSSVDLVISLGKPVVPNVVGSTQAAATTAITAVDNLTVGTVTTAYSDTVAAGLVISQTPVGGTEVNIGSSVDLVISLGKPVVPNVVGSTQAAATTAITAVDNLTVGTVTTAYSDTVAAGLVISQTPVGGTEVNIGSSVDLVISLGKPVVPNVVGSTQAAATTAITAVDNLTVGTVTTAYSDTVAAGLVISQTPVGGTEVNIGSSVDLVISLGKPVVPNVVGSTQAAATTAITAVDNLTVGTVTQQCSDTVPAGNVISQNPTGGTEVNIGSSVDLVISSGPCSSGLVPNVIGMTQAAAEAAITAVAGLTVGTETEQYSNTFAAGLVISQNPAGGTEVNDINLAPSCIGHWKLNDNAANTTVLDGSGTSHNGTASRNTNLLAAAGKINGAFLFNGTSDYVAAETIGTGSYTKAAWVNLELFTGAYSHNILSGGNQAFFAPEMYSHKLSAGHNNIWNQVQDPNSLAYGVWYFVAVTYNAGTNTLTLYKNGAVVSTGSTATPAGSSALYIGRYSSLASSYYKGLIDNVMLFNRALAGDEIAALYNGSNGTEVIPNLSVSLVVSLGKPVVPNVVGMTQAAATTAITAVDNLTVGTVTQAYSDTVAVGLVISQTPVGGTEVNIGSSVGLVVSLGKPTVPNVVGMTQAAATTAITAVDNLTVGTVTTAYSNTVAAGLVISQTPVGGTAVNTGSSVDLVISLGVQSQQFSITEDFNDNKRSAMWRMASYDSASTWASEYTSRLNLRTVNQMDLAPSCIGHWKLNDNAANTTVLDGSGTSHNGTASRNTNLLAAAGKINGAFLFNGTSDYVAVQTIGTGSYTKAAWVNLELFTGAYSHNILSGGNQAFFAPEMYSHKLSAGHNNIWNQVQDPNSLVYGVWYFVAVTYNAGTNTLTLYKNGAVVSTGSTATPAGSSALYIGRYSSLASSYYKGLIDNVMLFNRALAGDEIAALYNGSNGTETLPRYTTRNSEFSANGWGIDVNDNFQAKVDFHYSSVSSPAAWVGMTIGNDQDNYISILAGADGSSPYFQYKQVVNGVITSSAETPRALNDGTLYVSYDAALDELYLSYSGYGAANAWQTITGLLRGQWLAEPLNIAVGGGSGGSNIDNDQAYLDNFAVSGYLFGWPPATDLDGSGFIDWGDVAVIAENWLETGLNPADINNDDIVNFLDFAEVGLAW